MGKGFAFILGAVAGIVAYKVYKNDLDDVAQYHVAKFLDHCQPLRDEGKEWFDSTVKKVTDKFSSPGGNPASETVYTYTYPQETPDESQSADGITY